MTQIAQKWYVIHTVANTEEKVDREIRKRIEDKALSDCVFDVVVPKEKVQEIKSGKRIIKDQKVFLGYVLVKMVDLSLLESKDPALKTIAQKALLGIRKISKVTGFISSGKKPVPISDEEVDRILKRTEETKDKPAIKQTFSVGEQVRIKEGPFENFMGAIEEIHPDKGRMKVMVVIFGRTTPVDLEYSQVEKL
jgi:transcriptional antiterminator NusG